MQTTIEFIPMIQKKENFKVLKRIFKCLFRILRDKGNKSSKIRGLKTSKCCENKPFQNLVNKNTWGGLHN